MAYDAFLKFDDIDGESTDDQHKDWIDVSSFSWGMNQTGVASGGGGGGTGKVSVQDFHFTSTVHKGSPKLMLSTANGRHIKYATLSVRKAGERQADWIKIKLEDVLVSSYLPAFAPEAAPFEEVALNFSKITFDYTIQKADGSAGDTVSASWDLKSNTGA